MAKLNGVEIIEMKDGAVTKIKYDGEVYEYAEEFDAQRKAGNIVQNLSVTLDAEIGAFYETDRRGAAVDDVGDSHDVINEFGRTFVKAQETLNAKEGDLVRIIDKYSEGQPYDNGDVFTVSRTYGEGDGDIRVNNNSHFLLEQEYRVIDPKEDTPQVGDKIRVYDSFISEGNYVDGDVLKVTEILGKEDVSAEGVDVGLIRSEFEIVPTNTPVTKSSTCVKDDLNGRVDELEERVGKLETGVKGTKAIEKGDTVRLVSKEDSFHTLHGFSVGDLCEVLSLRYCVEDKVELMSEGGTWGVARLSNLVAVSRDVETEQERKPVEGDIVVITGNTNGSANEVGDIGIVTDIIGDLGSPCVKVRGRKHGRRYNHTEYSDMRLATAEERAEYYRKEKAEELKVGDYARVTGETLWNGIGEGTVVKVTKPTDSDGEHRIELLDGSDCDYAKPENLEKIDVNARELSFIRAGREPREHKKGDIVRVDDACGSPLIEGNLYELSCGGLLATISLDSGKWAAIVTLVTPVESRTDIEHDNE